MISDIKEREKLSVAIITLNAQRSLEGCLQSLFFADEIVLVDAGSTDETLAIARRYGAKVISQQWLGFGKQKQIAVAHTTYKWVLCIDADERITPPLQESIQRTLTKPSSAAYRLTRRNRFLGKWLSHGEGYPDYTVRLFDKTQARWSDDIVHEKVLVPGATGTLSGDLLHESEDGLLQYLAKQHRYTALQAQALYDSGERARFSKIMLSPLTRFLKFYVIRQGFRDGLPGFIHVALGCFNGFMKYAQLFELHYLAQAKENNHR